MTSIMQVRYWRGHPYGIRHWSLTKIYQVIDFIERRKQSSFFDDDSLSFGLEEILSSNTLDTHHLLQSFLQSIDTFPPCIGRKPNISSAIEGLRRTAEQFLRIDKQLTTGQQYFHMYPLRSWLNWFPDSLVPLTQGDMWVPVMLAHFYALTLTVIPMFPVVNTRIFINVRVRSIASILDGVSKTHPCPCRPCSDIHVAQSFMQFPNQVLEAFSRLYYGAGPYDDPLRAAYCRGIIID